MSFIARNLRVAQARSLHLPHAGYRPVYSRAVLYRFHRCTFYTFVQQYQQAVTLTFGKLTSIKEPGIRLYFPLIQSMYKVDLRTRVHELLPQMIITKDNVSCSVSAVIYYRISNAEQAVLRVMDVDRAIQQLAQTELRDLLCMKSFNDILENRDHFSQEITRKVEQRCADWGTRVESVQLKNIDLTNENMVRAMAKEAEATRERMAAIIRADGEYRAAVKLARAAQIFASDDTAIQLRRLQTLERIAKEKSETTLVVPMSVFSSGNHAKSEDIEEIDLEMLERELQAEEEQEEQQPAEDANDDESLLK